MTAETYESWDAFWK